MARRKNYNSYDDAFKVTDVALTEIPGVYATHVVKALGIHEMMLYRWRMGMRRLNKIRNPFVATAQGW